MISSLRFAASSALIVLPLLHAQDRLYFNALELQQSMTALVLADEGVQSGLAYFAGQDKSQAYFVTAQRLFLNPSKGQQMVRIRTGQPAVTLETRVLGLAAKEIVVLALPAAHLPEGLPSPLLTPMVETKDLYSIGTDFSRMQGSIVAPGPPDDDATFTTTFSSLSKPALALGAPLFDNDGRWVGLHIAATSVQGYAVTANSIVDHFRAWKIELVDRNQALETALTDLKSRILDMRVDAARRLGELGVESRVYRSTILYAMEEFLYTSCALPPDNPDDAAPTPANLSPIGRDVQAALGTISAFDWTGENRQFFGKVRTRLPHRFLGSQQVYPNTAMGNGIKLFDLQLNDAKAHGGWFLEANLSGSTIRSADFSAAHLRLANMPDADATSANLRGADLTGVDARYTSFQNADLENSNFQDSRLLSAVFTGANLRKAEFSMADLSRTIFNGAHVEGTNFADAINLSQRQVDTMLGDRTTRLPPRLLRPRSWSASLGDPVDERPLGIDDPAVQRMMTARIRVQRPGLPAETGSAFLVGRDSGAAYFVTAYHVVRSGDVEVEGIDLYLSGHTEAIPGKVSRGCKSSLGIALISIPVREIPDSLLPSPAVGARSEMPVHAVAGDGSIRDGTISPDQNMGATFTTSFSEAFDMVGYSGGPILAEDGVWIGMHTATGSKGVEIASLPIVTEVRNCVPGLITSAEALESAQKHFADSDRSQRLRGLAEFDRLGASIPTYRTEILDTLASFLRKTLAFSKGPADSPLPLLKAPPGQPSFETQAVLDLLVRHSWGVDSDDEDCSHVSPDHVIDLSELDLDDTNLDDARLNFVNLRDAHLNNALLANAHLQHTDLRRAWADGADLTDARMDGTNAEGAHFDSSTLKGVSLKCFSSLAGASFRNAALDKADLSGADFSNAIFIGASFHNVSFEDVTLEDAVFSNANVKGTSFLGAQGLVQEQLNSAIGDQSTKIRTPPFVIPNTWK